MGSTPICISRMRSSVHDLIFNSLRSCLGLATSMSQESQLKRQGIAASGGVCRGRVHLLDKKHLHVPQHRVSKDQLEAELSRFESAIVQTRKELKAMHQSLKEKVGSQHADIFEAHLMVLEDAALLQETHQMQEVEMYYSILVDRVLYWRPRVVDLVHIILLTLLMRIIEMVVVEVEWATCLDPLVIPIMGMLHMDLVVLQDINQQHHKHFQMQQTS